MTTISAAVVADSVSTAGSRLTTLRLRYPLVIHAEFMTHRVFSRNASSSRAIPVRRLIEDVKQDPFIPLEWGSNRPGMQAGDPLPANVQAECRAIWMRALMDAVQRAWDMSEHEPHKQIVNRLLAPFVHINVVVTSTEWKNFFDLRCHPAAEPHMRRLAEAIRDALAGSQPVTFADDAWHLPFIHRDEWELTIDVLRMVSAARCARVSYLTHDGRTTSTEEDLELAVRLERERHLSPFEHQAMPDVWRTGVGGGCWLRPEDHRNFVGWRQSRAMMEQN